MMHFDITMEDSRIIGDYREDDMVWTVLSIDGVTGQKQVFIMNQSQLEDCLALMFHPDGEPSNRNVEERYANVEELFVGCPRECRFIP